MEPLDYWRLCEELSIAQAALLIIGENPSYAGLVNNWDIDKRPDGYDAAITAISSGLKNFIRYQKEYQTFETQTENLRLDHANAPDMELENEIYLKSLYKRSIEGTLVQETEYDINGNDMGFIEGSVDCFRSIINVDSLKEWLLVKGFTTGFFFPEMAETMDFLDPQNPRYAPKLAASVKAWQSVTDAGKRSPKQALDKWLREHAVQFGLTNEDGKALIENAIEECSKVANWSPKGGATKTPS